MDRYCITPKDELMHYGVVGMKWGVRKDRGYSGRSKRPTMIDYSPEVVKKFYRKGVKAGPTDSAIGRTQTSRDEQDRIIKDLKGRYIRIGFATIRVRDMMASKDKLARAVSDWAEAQDAKIRDDFQYGKISKKQAERKWDQLATDTDRMYKEIEDRQRIYNRGQSAVHNSSLMAAQMHQQQVQNQIFQQQATQAAMRNASLGLSGGMNPFMFG